MAALATLTLFGTAEDVIGNLRPPEATSEPATLLRVTSSADRGPGTLREAILRSNSGNETVHILFDVQRIELTTPLPPLANSHGVRLDGEDVAPLIDAGRMGSAPVLDLRAGDSEVANIRILNAPQSGILVRADGVTLSNVQVDSSAVGVAVYAEASDLVIERSHFANNTVGIQVDGSASSVTIQGTSFEGQSSASIWAVRGADPTPTTELWIAGNTFTGDLRSLVLGNVGARVSQNVIERSIDSGIYIIGSGVDVTDNTIRESGFAGIVAVQADRSTVARNEVSDNAAVGILLNGSQGLMVEANNVYRNGHGMIVVLGVLENPNTFFSNDIFANQLDGMTIVASDPVLQANRVFRNRLSGVRVLDLERYDSPPLKANPLFRDNELRDNGVSGRVFGTYPRGPR